MTALQTIAVTVLALAVVCFAGAAMLSGHATFDQFLGVAGGGSGAAALLHALLPQRQVAP